MIGAFGLPRTCSPFSFVLSDGPVSAADGCTVEPGRALTSFAGVALAPAGALGAGDAGGEDAMLVAPNRTPVAAGWAPQAASTTANSIGHNCRVGIASTNYVKPFRMKLQSMGAHI